MTHAFPACAGNSAGNNRGSYLSGRIGYPSGFEINHRDFRNVAGAIESRHYAVLHEPCKIFQHRHKLLESKFRGVGTASLESRWSGRTVGNLESHVPGFSKS